MQTDTDPVIHAYWIHKKIKEPTVVAEYVFEVPVPAFVAINKLTWKRKNARTAVQLCIRRPYDKSRMA